MSKSVPIYRAIMLEIERRRQALGFPMEKFSEYAGLPERYLSKAVHSDTKSGRQAQWSTLQVIVDALFPCGFDVVIKARPGPAIDEASLKAKLLQLRATTDPKSQRELMGELGRKGGAASRKNLSESRRRVLARRAGKAGAKARWQTPEIVEIIPIRGPHSNDGTSR